MNIISKIESNIKELAINKFLEIDPKTYPSSVHTGSIKIEIELIKNKSCLTVTLTKNLAIFSIDTLSPLSGAFSISYQKSCAFQFTKYINVGIFSSKQNKRIKQKAAEFFQFKYREILNDNLDIKSSRRLKLKEIINGT